MLEQFFQAVSEQLKAPKADFEKNMRAFFSDTLDRMDIVSRDTLLRQEKQLIEAQQAITVLKQQVEVLEKVILERKEERTEERTED